MFVRVNASDVGPLLGMLGDTRKKETIQKIYARLRGVFNEEPIPFANPTEILLSTLDLGPQDLSVVCDNKEMVESLQDRLVTLVDSLSNDLTTQLDESDIDKVISVYGSTMKLSNNIASLSDTERGPAFVFIRSLCKKPFGKVYSIRHTVDEIRKKHQETGKIVHQSISKIVQPIVDSDDPNAVESCESVFDGVDESCLREIKSEVSKKRGSRLEHGNLNSYESRNNKAVSNRNTVTKTMKITSDGLSVLISGKIDGSHDDMLVESKNRQSARTFGKGLKPYDRAQLVLYMKMFNKKKGVLVENWGDESAQYEVEYDPEEWDTLKSDILRVVGDNIVV